MTKNNNTRTIDYSKWDTLDCSSSSSSSSSDSDNGNNNSNCGGGGSLQHPRPRVTRLDQPCTITRTATGDIHIHEAKQEEKETNENTKKKKTTTEPPPKQQQQQPPQKGKNPTAVPSTLDTSPRQICPFPPHSWTNKGGCCTNYQGKHTIYWSQDRTTITMRIRLPGTLLHFRDATELDLATTNRKAKFSCSVSNLLPYHRRESAVGVGATIPAVDRSGNAITQKGGGGGGGSGVAGGFRSSAWLTIKLLSPQTTATISNRTTGSPSRLSSSQQQLWLRAELPHPVHADDDTPKNAKYTREGEYDDDYDHVDEDDIDWSIVEEPSWENVVNDKEKEIEANNYTNTNTTTKSKYLVVTLNKAVPMPGMCVWWTRPLVDADAIAADTDQHGVFRNDPKGLEKRTRLAQVWQEAHDKFRASIEQKHKIDDIE